MKECVTHHYACDCREGQFKELLAAAKEAKKMIEANFLQSVSAREVRNILNEAIAKAEARQ